VAFPDVLRFILAVKAMGIPVAAASSSKNDRLFLERIRLDTFAAEQRLDYDFVRPGMTLEELFDADLVVTTLDDVSLHGLAEGRLRERRAAAELRGRYTERPPSVWTVVYDGFDPARQGLREALCALGNGYLVTRGVARGPCRWGPPSGHPRGRTV